MSKQNVVVIIPARGGSKSIKGKNLIKLGGKPLIAWPIDLALSIKSIDRVIVSTEDQAIANTALKYGAEVPFIRPKKLADDKTPTLPVLQHALDYLDKKNYRTDIVLLMYATSPFIKRERILEALDLFKNPDCNSVLGVKKVRGRVWKYNDIKSAYQPLYPKVSTNRQYFTPLLEEAGNIFFSRYNVLMKMKTIIDPKKVKFIYVGEDEQLDIDTPQDLKKARNYLKLKKHEK